MLKVKKITSITNNQEPKKVYDFTVKDASHYIINGGIVSHNSGPIFAASMVIGMKKGKLKEDESGKKTTTVQGIRSMIHILKSRYSKPFERAEINIPYDSGLDPYSGLIDFFEARGVFVKDGNKLSYTAKDGTITKEFRKNITNDVLDQIMSEWDESSYGFKGITVEADSDHQS